MGSQLRQRITIQKQKNRTQKPAPSPKRKKKMVQSDMVPLPEGCEDLNLLDIADDDIEQFKNKIEHKPDHVQRELVELRRKLKNRDAAMRSREKRNLGGNAANREPYWRR